MKKILSTISLLLLLSILVGSLASCELPFGNDNGGGGNNPPATEHVHVDYVSQLKLDMSSSTCKQEVTVKFHIDGDTTHFNVPKSLDSTGVMKARYLAVNTPESTGKIEEWGKKASSFTEEKLATAHSIIVESNSSTWEFDGNGRYLVWVWYQSEEGAEYRNLNMELLQNGLAAGSKSSDTIYGDMAVKAIAQATIEKLYIFSDDIDPDFPYGAAESVTLKELRLNIDNYVGKKVAVQGVVSFNSNNTEYIEAYDAETGLYFGIQVFDGYQTAVTSMLKRGNLVRLVGVVTEFHGTYQISSIEYNVMKPEDPANSAILKKGETVAFINTTPETFTGDVEIFVSETEKKTFRYEALTLSTSISMENLTVTDIYTTTSESSDDKGAMTLTCMSNGIEISVRTEVLKDADGNLVTAEYIEGATIDVKGIVDYFDYSGSGNGTYQIRVYKLSDIVKH